MLNLWGVGFLFVLFFPYMSKATLDVQLFVNDVENQKMQAQAPTNLKFKFFDSEKTDPIHHFHLMHEKEVHLILVSEDLSSFSHLHPYKLSPHGSTFGININQETQDPFNLDAPHAVSSAGNYFLFSETMPMGYSMTTLPLDLHADGVLHPQAPLKIDPVKNDGSIEKIFDDYKVILKPMPYPHCGILAILLEAELYTLDPSRLNFTPVTDLQPWLNSFAHSVLISESGLKAKDRSFVHLHAVWPLTDDPESERGPYLRIASESHTPLREGIFKVWLQFKHRNQVQTLPFVIEVKAPPAAQSINQFTFCN